MAVRQENHRVIAEPMPAHTPGRLAEAGDFGGGQVFPRPHVGVFMTLGKGKLRHGNILREELSCLRWLDPNNEQSATSATTLTSIADIPEKTSKQESPCRNTGMLESGHYTTHPLTAVH